MVGENLFKKVVSFFLVLCLLATTVCNVIPITTLATTVPDSAVDATVSTAETKDQGTAEPKTEGPAESMESTDEETGESEDEETTETENEETTESTDEETGESEDEETTETEDEETTESTDEETGEPEDEETTETEDEETTESGDEENIVSDNVGAEESVNQILMFSLRNTTYPVYFNNSNNWNNVGAYIYGDQGELLGTWGSTMAGTSDLGGNWLQVNVSAAPPYSIVFFNADDDSQRTELYLDASDKIYVTGEGAFNSKDAAEGEEEDPVPTPDPEPETYPVYFKNTNNWSNVGAYIYGDQGELLGTWGSTTAGTSDLGGNWLQVNVSAAPPYSIIFYNKDDDSQRVELLLDASDKIYVTNNGAFTSKDAAEGTDNPDPDPDPVTYPVYFNNTGNWTNVGAYIYGEQGELLGTWGSTTAGSSDLGGSWLQVDVSAEPPYSIIFYNKDDDSQRVELLLDASDKIYVTNNGAFTSKDAAEESQNSGNQDPDEPGVTYPLYFLNTNGWTNVGAYIYGAKGELLGTWGSTSAGSSELGENWLQVNVSAEPPYNVIFYNKDNEAQRAELLIDAANKIYVTKNGQAFSSQQAAEDSLKYTPGAAQTGTTRNNIPKPYSVYFLNSENWARVGAYIYGDKGELLGRWGSTFAEKDEELGGNWMKVGVSALPPYSIIFYNTAEDSQRSELFLDAEDKLFVTVRAQAFTSREAAENGMGPVEEHNIFFLNSSGWEEVGAYIYGDKGELLGSWGSTNAVPASELGENWMKVTVTALPPYSIIFYNKADEAQRAELLLDAEDKLYVTAGNEAFTTQADAQAAAGVTAAIDPNNRNYGPGVEVIEEMNGK